MTISVTITINGWLEQLVRVSRYGWGHTDHSIDNNCVLTVLSNHSLPLFTLVLHITVSEDN